MDIYDEIFEKAQLLVTGELSEGKAAALREMCAAAFAELSNRLREGIAAADIQEQFVRACAALALSLYVGVEADNVGSFSAGSLRVSRRSGADVRESAQSLRKQAELMLTGYLKDGGFAFRAVKA